MLKIRINATRPTICETNSGVKPLIFIKVVFISMNTINIVSARMANNSRRTIRGFLMSCFSSLKKCNGFAIPNDVAVFIVVFGE